MSNDSIGKTFLVAIILCIVCSVLVSTAAVKLKPIQEANKAKFTRVNILKAADLYKQGQNTAEAFKNIETKIVNINTGEFNTELNPATYDWREALTNAKLSQPIPKDKDLANIKRRVKATEVYLVKKNGKLDTIILPIYGKGLWSTMYAFLALDEDGNTVKGLTFYDHGETPGLGGEIENPAWQANWVGKKIYDENGDLAFSVLKGKVDENRPAAVHQVDGLSGATLTTNGVGNLIKYWLGPDGFKKFLTNIREQQGVENG